MPPASDCSTAAVLQHYCSTTALLQYCSSTTVVLAWMGRGLSETSSTLESLPSVVHALSVLSEIVRESILGVHHKPMTRGGGAQPISDGGGGGTVELTGSGLV
jgi:hypothetical protein